MDDRTNSSNLIKSMAKTVGLVAFCALLIGCSQEDKRVYFEGKHFRASAKAPRSDRADFTVRVRKATVNLSAAAEAGRYEANKHCIRYFGRSDKTWTNGPDQDPTGFTLDGETLVLTGRCTE